MLACGFCNDRGKRNTKNQNKPNLCGLACQTVKEPLGGIGGPQPSDCRSETSGVHCGPNPTFGRFWASALRERFELSSRLGSLCSPFRWLRPKPNLRSVLGFGVAEALCAVLTPRFALLTLPVVSEPLRSKGFLSPFAARRAEGEKANGAKVVKKVAIGEFFDELTSRTFAVWLVYISKMC